MPYIPDTLMSEASHEIGNPFDCLPAELVYQILEKLPVRSLSAISRTSRALYVSCQDERLWRREIINLKNNKLFLECSEEMLPGPDEMDSNELRIPGPRLCHIAVAHGDSMWIHGGHNTVRNTQWFAEVNNDLWRYKFEERKWEQENSPNLPHKTEHSAVVYDNKLWLFGGYSGERFSSSLYSYDFATNECKIIQQHGEIPPERSAHVGVVYGSKMYIFGGWNGAEQNNDLYSFDFENYAWKKINYKGPAPAPRCSHAAVVSDKYRCMFVFAGYGGPTHKYLNDMCQFDFVTETWQICEHTPLSPRSRMRLVELGDKVYIYGGWNKEQEVHFNNLYEYDIERSHWQEVKLELGPDEGKIGQHSMIVYNGILYIFAGYNSALQTSTNDLYAYRLSRPALISPPSSPNSYQT